MTVTKEKYQINLVLIQHLMKMKENPHLTSDVNAESWHSNDIKGISGSEEGDNHHFFEKFDIRQGHTQFTNAGGGEELVGIKHPYFSLLLIIPFKNLMFYITFEWINLLLTYIAVNKNAHITHFFLLTCITY
ncbi:hypothetical protein ACJX0J_021025 [Zea mays]